MRYIIIAILIYVFYLLLKFIVRLYVSAAGKGGTLKEKMSRKKRSKIDLNKIEEAEYEEIKKPDKEK